MGAYRSPKLLNVISKVERQNCTCVANKAGLSVGSWRTATSDVSGRTTGPELDPSPPAKR